jgi:hypothetical protein
MPQAEEVMHLTAALEPGIRCKHACIDSFYETEREFLERVKALRQFVCNATGQLHKDATW